MKFFVVKFEVPTMVLVFCLMVKISPMNKLFGPTSEPACGKPANVLEMCLLF